MLCNCPSCTGTGFTNGHGFLSCQPSYTPSYTPAYTYALPTSVYGAPTMYTTLLNDGGCQDACCTPQCTPQTCLPHNHDIEINLNAGCAPSMGYSVAEPIVYTPLTYAVGGPTYAAPMMMGMGGVMGGAGVCTDSCCTGPYMADMTANSTFDRSFARIERERRRECGTYDSYGQGGCGMM